jgi:Pyruvate/2-oxoacid:ferredoxin oxidoreductase delta subunit
MAQDKWLFINPEDRNGLGRTRDRGWIFCPDCGQKHIHFIKEKEEEIFLTVDELEDWDFCMNCNVTAEEARSYCPDTDLKSI